MIVMSDSASGIHGEAIKMVERHGGFSTFPDKGNPVDWHLTYASRPYGVYGSIPATGRVMRMYVRGKA